MQEQNFEKQVQHKLEELSLTPSAPVWQKVEQEIREKKKRRRMIAFWLFPMLLGAGMFWGIQTLTNKTDHEVSKIDTSNTPFEKRQPSTPSNKVTDTNLEKQPATIISMNPETTETTKNSTSVEAVEKGSPATVMTYETIPTTPVKSIQEKAYHTKPIRIQSNKPATIATRKNKFNPTHPLKQKSAITAVPDEAILLTTVNEPILNITTERIKEITSYQASNSIVKAQPLEQLIAIKEGEIKPTITSDSILNKKGQEKVRKWSWAAQAYYGNSSLQTSFLSKAFGTPLVYSSPQSNSGFPSTPSPPMSMFMAPRIENGPAFHTNIAVKRNFTKRFAVTAALQFSYLSLKTNVGQTVVRDTMINSAISADRVLNQFFRSAQSSDQLQEYVNKYHFLELPLGIEWKVNKRFPLHIQTGISLSYLLKTNALVFDPNARIFYQNNDLYSKMQLQFFSGITYQIWQHKNLGIHVGPYLQYGLSGLQKEDKNHHLLSTGLKAAFSF